MLLCLALQCFTDASALQMQIAYQSCVSELQIRSHTGAISNGLRARGAGLDLIQDAYGEAPAPPSIGLGSLCMHLMKNWSVLVQNGVTIVHEWFQMGPKWCIWGPKSSQNGSRELAGRLRGAKMAYRASKDRKRRPNGPQKGAIRVLKGSPKWTKS